MQVGERTTVTRLEPIPGSPIARAHRGSWNNLPLDCRYGGCDCAERFGSKTAGHYGRTVEYPGTVERVIHYADNSVEAEVACDDGETRRVMLSPPSGDACY